MAARAAVLVCIGRGARDTNTSLPFIFILIYMKKRLETTEKINIKINGIRFRRNRIDIKFISLLNERRERRDEAGGGREESSS